MSIAVTKGKISTTGKNLTSGSEDLLTATVFGLLRYLPAEILLVPILRKAINLSNCNLKLENSISDNSISFIFWPNLDHSEPDLEIKFGDVHCIFIEAKFNSGISGADKKDQLFRQFKDLNIQDSCNKSLIFLTADRLLPEATIKDSAKSVKAYSNLCEKDFLQRTYWLSWFDIWKFCKDFNSSDNNLYQKRLVQDIVEYLEKLGLKHFTGISDKVNVTGLTNPLFYDNKK